MISGLHAVMLRSTSPAWSRVRDALRVAGVADTAALSESLLLRWISLAGSYDTARLTGTIVGDLTDHAIVQAQPALFDDPTAPSDAKALKRLRADANRRRGARG